MELKGPRGNLFEVWPSERCDDTEKKKEIKWDGGMHLHGSRVVHRNMILKEILNSIWIGSYKIKSNFSKLISRLINWRRKSKKWVGCQVLR